MKFLGLRLHSTVLLEIYEKKNQILSMKQNGRAGEIKEQDIMLNKYKIECIILCELAYCGICGSRVSKSKMYKLCEQVVRKYFQEAALSDQSERFKMSPPKMLLLIKYLCLPPERFET